MGQNGPFSPNFKSKYLSELTSYRNDQGMTSPLKFSNFPKMLPKRAFRTHNTPKTTNDKTQKISKSHKFGFCHLWFWLCCGCEKPFLATFSESWGILEVFPYLDRFCTGKTRWDILTWNLVKNDHFGPKEQYGTKWLIFWVFQRNAPKSHTKVTDQILILSSIESLYRSLSSPGARASMCTHQAHPLTFYNFWGPIFRSNLPLILRVWSQNDHGCACWVHILGPALGVNKGLIWVYKPSKFHVLTPLASTRHRTTPHFTTRIGTHLRSFFIYHGEPKVRSLPFFDGKPADEITFRVFVVRIPNFQCLFGH